MSLRQERDPGAEEEEEEEEEEFDEEELALGQGEEMMGEEDVYGGLLVQLEQCNRASYADLNCASLRVFISSQVQTRSQTLGQILSHGSHGSVPCQATSTLPKCQRISSRTTST